MFLTGSYALRVAVDCLIEVIFSTLKSAKFALDVPKIVSRWPFTHGVQTPLHSSFIQCNHDFFEATSEIRPLSKGKSDNDGLSVFDLEIPVKNRKVLGPKPHHRIFLTGMVYTSTLPSLSQALCALAETHRRRKRVITEGKEKALRFDFQDMSSSSSSSGSNSTNHNDENDRCSMITGNSNGDVKVSTNQCDKTLLKDPLWQRLDETFMHMKSLHNRTTNYFKEEEKKPSGGTAVTLHGIEVSVPKVPFIFTTIQIDPIPNMTIGTEGEVDLDSTNSMIASSRRNEGIEVNDDDADYLHENEKGNREGNILGNSDKYNDQSTLRLKSGWLDRQRAGENLYFVVRTTSLSASEKFSYYSPDIISPHDSQAHIDGDSYDKIANNLTSKCANTLPVDGVNGFTEMNSFMPIDEISWNESVKSDISAHSSYKKSDNHLNVVDQNSITTNLGKKRKHSINSMSNTGDDDDEKDIIEPATDEIIFGEKLRMMYLVKVQHSSALRITNLLSDPEVSGAVLKPMNEYEIYAPETLEDRERKRMS